jgi:hypothetical protein
VQQQLVGKRGQHWRVYRRILRKRCVNVEKVHMSCRAVALKFRD